MRTGRREQHSCRLFLMEVKHMAIHTLSIDLETFSDVDLKKCGVYKYAESPDFEILLFGVSVDGGDVTVYDLASGDTVPE